MGYTYRGERGGGPRGMQGVTEPFAPLPRAQHRTQQHARATGPSANGKPFGDPFGVWSPVRQGGRPTLGVPTALGTPPYWVGTQGGGYLGREVPREGGA